jgi:hypothetical protein
MSKYDINKHLAEHEMRLSWSSTCDPERTYHEQESRRARARAHREQAWEEKQAGDEEWYANKAAEDAESHHRQEQQRLAEERRREEDRARRLEFWYERQRQDEQIRVEADARWQAEQRRRNNR